MNIWNILALLGFLLMIGTAGASDFSDLNMTQVIVQSLAGLGLFLVGIRGSIARAEAEGENDGRE